MRLVLAPLLATLNLSARFVHLSSSNFLHFLLHMDALAVPFYFSTLHFNLSRLDITFGQFATPF